MNRREAIRAIIDIIEPGQYVSREAVELAQRFRAALMDANPDLTEADMGTYDEAFGSELQPLSEAVRNARIELLVNRLTEEEAAAWEKAATLPEIGVMFASLQRLSPELGQAIQGVFQFEGVGAHARSAQKLFTKLGADAETGTLQPEAAAAGQP